MGWCGKAPLSLPSPSSRPADSSASHRARVAALTATLAGLQAAQNMGTVAPPAHRRPLQFQVQCCSDCRLQPASVTCSALHSGRVLQVPMTACQKVWCRQLSVQKHCILPGLAEGHILHNSVPV